jgi:outer membrane receptor protein involved in Fe transport
MRKMLWLAILFGNCSVAFAQQPSPNNQKPTTANVAQNPKGNGRITGIIIDPETNKPVEYATVALFPATGEKPIDGTVCNEKGQFELKNLAAGTYKLTISFLGYESKTLPEIVLTTANSEVSIGQISLKSDSKKLNEVNITTERELFENKIDRIVYNAEKDAGNRGGNASDVLKKVPQVTVDLDGNVQLRGSSNIKVLINNKPSSIMAASVADAMKQIPSDMIKSVEVITSPSAKYDAEGTAGIINIITKKSNIEGVNGSVYTTFGTLSSNVGASVNRRSGKLGLNANIGSNMWNVDGKTAVKRTDFDASGSQAGFLQQKSDFNNGGLFTYAQLGMDYDFNEKNTMNAGVRLNQSRFRNKNELFSSFAASNQLTEYCRYIDSRNYSKSVDVNMGFTHTYKPQHEFSLLGLYSRNPRENLYDLDQTNLAGERTYREKNTNDNTNQEITFQADYAQPFKNKQLLETGAKGILRNVFSDYRFANDLTGSGEFVSQPSRSDLFEYDQNVVAGYVSYGFSLGKKYSFKVGSRYEHTFINADFRSTETRFTTDYKNFIPNVMVSRDLKENQKLKISYNRRIQRPLIFYLNPYVNTSDPLNISYGNPNLDPELTDAYEVGYNTFFKKGSVNASLYWRQTNNAIETVRFLDENQVVNNTYRNIARNNTVGLSLFGSLKPTDKISLSGNANFFYTSLKSEVLQTTNSNVQANFNLNANWQFKEGWAVEAFGFYNSPRVQLQGNVSGMRYYNFSVKKDIWQKKGSISMGLDNVFETSTMVRTTYETPGTVFENESRFFRRGIRVSFNYNFGKMQFNAPRKKTIRNDDVKGEGGNGGNGQ